MENSGPFQPSAANGGGLAANPPGSGGRPCGKCAGMAASGLRRGWLPKGLGPRCRPEEGSVAATSGLLCSPIRGPHPHSKKPAWLDVGLGRRSLRDTAAPVPAG